MKLLSNIYFTGGNQEIEKGKIKVVHFGLV